MENRVISKKKFKDWLKELARVFTLVGPVPNEDAPPEFREFSPDENVILDNSRWELPPKELLLPRYETLFIFDTAKGEEKVESAIPPAQRTMMVGLRPCDVQSIAVLDKVYLDGQFKDPYYAARRAGIVTMAIVCDKKRWSCFCSSVGDPIEWVKSANIVLTDIGDSYMATIFDEANAAYVNSGLFDAPTEGQIAELEKIWNSLKESQSKFEAEQVASSVDWNEDSWDKIAQKCLGCGICSFLCPTCTCFDIQDERLPGGKVERYRVRDTCQFCHFTKMGHGHNPRPGKKERARQRLSHKFKYTVETCGVLSCTGCGRCVELCPVNVDIRKVIDEVVKSEDRESVTA